MKLLSQIAKLRQLEELLHLGKMTSYDNFEQVMKSLSVGTEVQYEVCVLREIQGVIYKSLG